MGQKSLLAHFSQTVEISRLLENQRTRDVPQDPDDAILKIKRLLTAILLLMSFSIAFFAKSLLLPIVLGLLLALTLSPLVRAMARLGVPSGLSAGFIIFGMAGALAAFVFLMGGTISAWVDDVPRMGADIREKLSAITQSVEAVQDASKEVEEITQSSGPEVQRVVVERPALLATAVSNLAGFTTSLAIGMVLAFFLLASGDTFYLKLVQSFPRMAERKRALKIVYDIERRISHYLLAIAAINLCLGVAIAVALLALGMPYAYLWGLLAFALNFVPFIGALAGTAAVSAVSIVTFDTLGYAAFPPLAYLSLTMIEGNFITPLLLGKRLALNTVSVFLTVIFWAWLWGIPGALMAVPALVALKVVADNFERLSTLANFLSGRASDVDKATA